MNFRQPMVLLLGGLLSASSVGCSALSAVVAEYRPASRDAGRGSADRMVAIGRTFENQGRYDQAEAMYRKALKERPQDQEIRQQLAQLAERRNGRSFSGSSVQSAIAAADAMSSGGRRQTAPGSGRARFQPRASQQTVAAATTQSSASNSGVQLTSAGPASLDQLPTLALAQETSTVTSVESRGGVTVEQILECLNAPDEHHRILLSGLEQSDSPDVQCLAATLLGECSTSNTEIRDALAAAAASAPDERLVLAVESARILRGEADQGSADRLISLLSSTDQEIQIQAASELRVFSGSAAEASCIQALRGLLTSDEDRVRAIAAVTLGDFVTCDSETHLLLEKLAVDDLSGEVREAAASAVGRCAPVTTTDVTSIQVIPRS